MHLLLLEYMVSKRETRDGVGDVRRAEMCVMGGGADWTMFEIK